MFGAPFQLFGAPFTSYLMLLFLAAAVPGRVLVLIAFDYPVGTWTVGSLVVIVPLLVLVWFLSRDRIIEVAPEREGFTGEFPMVARAPIDRTTKRRSHPTRRATAGRSFGTV